MMKWWWGTMGVLKKHIENIKGAKLGNRGKRKFATRATNGCLGH
jgi:hypothetical protein